MAIKEYHKRFNIDPMELTIASYFLQGILMLFVVYSMEFAPYDVMRDNILAGCFSLVANTLANYSTTRGYGGPASALFNIQVILQVLIDAIFLDQIPNWMQLLAVVSGIVGSLIISLGPILWKWMFNEMK